MRQPLGQHFLTDQKMLEKIASLLAVNKKLTVVEIGSGKGQLTKYIVERLESEKNSMWKLICVEKDKTLIPEFKKKINSKNVRIVIGDALKIIPKIKSQCAIIGNIPYYITGFLLRVIGDMKTKPSQVVLLIQNEVADRLCARPQRMNILAASVHYWGVARKICVVPAGSFSPPPNVLSAVIVIERKKEKLPCPQDEYMDGIKIIFKQPRKMVATNLSWAGFEKESVKDALQAIHVKQSARPQDLSVDDICALIKKIKR